MKCYRRDGTAYPGGEKGLVQWGKDFSNFDYKIVKQDKLANGVFVSTVWLGLDHNYGFNNRPLIFETMVFGPGDHSEDCLRYSTEEEARLGHKMIVKKWSTYKSAEMLLKGEKT
jgi:hypothetical protein